MSRLAKAIDASARRETPGRKKPPSADREIPPQLVGTLQVLPPGFRRVRHGSPVAWWVPYRAAVAERGGNQAELPGACLRAGEGFGGGFLRQAFPAGAHVDSLCEAGHLRLFLPGRDHPVDNTRGDTTVLVGENTMHLFAREVLLESGRNAAGLEKKRSQVRHLSTSPKRAETTSRVGLMAPGSVCRVKGQKLFFAWPLASDSSTDPPRCAAQPGGS